MRFFWEEDLVNGVKETKSQRNRRRVRRLLLLFLLLSVLSSSTIGYLIGRIVYRDFYSSQIIDTINIDFSKVGANEYFYIIRLLGKVQYKTGQPFVGGTVELQSDPRYTVTDEGGLFEFENVQEGEHLISVIGDGEVLASKNIIIEVDPSIIAGTIERQPNGTFLIRVPIDIVTLQIILEIDIDGGKGADGLYDMEVLIGTRDENGNLVPRPPIDPEEPDPEKPDPEKPDPEKPDPEEPDPEKPDPEEPDPEKPDPEKPDPEKPDPEKPKPEPEPDPPKPPGWGGIEVSDDEDGKKNIWSSNTVINIFSAITQHHNVQKIDGKTVIAPGSYGSFVFQVKNNNNYAINMDIALQVSDANTPKLPMIFRMGIGKVLRSVENNSSYVGNTTAWKQAEDITEAITMKPNEVRVYTLQWEWDDSNDVLDTAIGNQATLPDYIINILVNANYP